MSNYLAIATVNAALRLLLQEAAAASGISGARASSVRPDTKTFSDNAEKDLPRVGVNVFLYQLMQNASLRNIATPTRRSDGSVMTHTRTAYDLDYLLSFYGDEHKFEPQFILGRVIQALQSKPVLTKERIRAAKLTYGSLASSNLDEETELVKFSMSMLSLDEMSKLWSVFFQVPYRLSVAFKATVVFIEGEEQARPAPPVRLRRIYVKPVEQPVIERVLSQKTLVDPVEEDAPILAGQFLVLDGRKLRGESTLVRIGALTAPPAEISETRIKVRLAAPPFDANRLRAGVHGVQVVHNIKMGIPPVDHKGFESNVAPLILNPSITPSVSGIVVDGGHRNADLKIDFVPDLGVDQRLVVMLNEFNPPSGRLPYAYHYAVPLPDAPPDFINTITIPVHVLPAEYLVRVQVDGAESLLTQDPDPTNPLFNGPKVAIL